MARFEPDKRPEDPAVREIYKEIVAGGLQGPEEGVPLHAFTILSKAPHLLQGLWEITKGVVISGSLPPTVKQMIAMTIAMQSNCRYCEIGHTRALEAMGVPTEIIKSCASDPELADIPPSQRAIVKFALKTAQAPKSITDEDLASLRRHGLNDGEIMEVIMMVAWSQMLNTWTDATAVPVDGEE